MDISPGDSTPTSETSYTHTPTTRGTSHQQQQPPPQVQPQTQQQQAPPQMSSEHHNSNTTGPVLLASALPHLVSHPPHPHIATPTSTASLARGTNLYQPAGKSSTQQIPSPVQQSSTSSTPSMVPAPLQGSVAAPGPGPGPPVTLANLPRLLSQITGAKNLEQSELSPQKALQTLQTALLLSRQVSLEPGAGGSGVSAGLNNQHPQPLQPLKVDTTTTTSIGEGPPTPTHSESQDCVDARKCK